MLTWIICANQGGAKIFECRKPSAGAKLIRHFPHPEGGLHEGDIITDRPGAKFSGTPSPVQHGTSSPMSQKERMADDFARHLSQELTKAQSDGHFDSLIACADPQFLGKLRESFTTPLKSCLIGTIDKNIYFVDERGVMSYVKDLAIEAARKAA